MSFPLWYEKFVKLKSKDNTKEGSYIGLSKKKQCVYILVDTSTVLHTAFSTFFEQQTMDNII